MNIKKKLPILLLMTMLSSGMIMGCSTTEENDTSLNGNSGTESENTEKGYVFEINGTQMAPDADVMPIVATLGEAKSYFEEDSCATQGISKIYTYPGFVITTYEDGTRDLIESIILKDDSVSTPEGADLSMTRADVIGIYGGGYKETKGMIAYSKGGMKLCFIFENENVVAIEYCSVILD